MKIAKMRMWWAALTVVVAASAAWAADPVRVAVMADNRGTDGFVDILKAAKALVDRPAAILMPGDIDPPARTRDQISTVFGKEFPWYPVVGNHEVELPEYVTWMKKDFAQRVKAGNATVVSGPKGTEETSYSFDLGPIHFVVLDEYWDGTAENPERWARGEVAKELRAWAEKDLAASKKPWKLVVGHEPAYPAPDRDHGDARHVGSSLDAAPEARDAFWKMLEEQHVTAYICGHTHRYSRVQPEGSKVWQIDSGQARGDSSWKYDTFVMLTATEGELKVETYRNLKTRGAFSIADTMTLKAAATRPAATTAPVPAGAGH